MRLRLPLDARRLPEVFWGSFESIKPFRFCS